LPNVALNTKNQSINQSSNDPEKKDKWQTKVYITLQKQNKD
jgi:hypothetical protein